MPRTRPRGRVRPARRMRLAPLGGGRHLYSTIGALAATRLLAAVCWQAALVLTKPAVRLASPVDTTARKQ